MKHILFVCSGNVFRSMSAEYCLEKELKKHKITNWQVMSAGITAKKQPIDTQTRAVLKMFGIKTVKHHQHKLNKKMLEKADIVIAMAKNHKDFIESNFGYKKVVMFNKLAIGKNSSIWDIEDEVKDYQNNRKGVEKKIKQTIQYIFWKTPSVFKKLNILFS